MPSKPTCPGDVGRSFRQQPHDGQSGDAFAAAGFSDQSERHAAREFEVLRSRRRAIVWPRSPWKYDASGLRPRQERSLPIPGGKLSRDFPFDDGAVGHTHADRGGSAEIAGR